MPSQDDRMDWSTWITSPRTRASDMRRHQGV